MSKLEQEISAAGSAIHVTENDFSKSYIFPSNFIGFDGHFPDNPILPAVVQLMAGTIAATEAIGNSFSVDTISRAKFVRPICPDETLAIAGTLRLKGDKTLAAITIHVGEELAATFTVTLSEGK